MAPRVSMGQCDRSHLQDSKRGGESFWDGLGVEFEAKQVLDARVCEWGFALWGVRGPGSARDGGTWSRPRTGDTGPPPDGGTRGRPGRGRLHESPAAFYAPQPPRGLGRRCWLILARRGAHKFA